MRLLLLLVMGVACGLGGYWLGQRPNSPDVIGWLSTGAVEVGGQIDRAVDAGREEFGPLFATPQAADEEPAAESSPDAKDTSPATAGRQGHEAPAIPQCW